MSRNVFYRYNADTDNFERVYPSLRSRLISWGRTGILALVLATVIGLIAFYCFDSPTLENLRVENSRLKAQYNILERRLENSMKVMRNIQERDDNFYRVMMQMDPMSSEQRYAGFENESRLRELSKLNDAALVSTISQTMDLFERQLSSQVQSFDQLRQMVSQQQERFAHIPSILPISMSDYTMSSGYGYRMDPIYGSTKFHEGLDFAASTGTKVFATADGKVALAKRAAGFGNCVEIDHGFNYLSRYAHLSEILVKEGELVKRGQLIGKVGSTGKSTGPHLHYEVRFKDESQNPVHYYFMDLTPEQYAEMIRTAENAGHVMD